MHPILAQRWRLALYVTLFLQAGVLAVEVLRSTSGGERHELWILVLPLFAIHAFSCLASWYLCRALPLGKTEPVRLVIAQLGSALLASLAVVGLGAWWAHVLGEEALYRGGVALISAFALFLYSLAAALHYLFLALAASRAAEARAFELRLLAREAELQALRAQLDPHFLFNSLHSISALVTRSPEKAREMCVRLADFLRRTVRVGPRRHIRLADELQLARDYLAVEQTRFGERLAIRFTIAEEIEEGLAKDAKELVVPPLILQPLIENAVRHGIAHLLDGGRIEVTVARVADGLRLRVDNPCDPDRPRATGEGVGLENVRRRLQASLGGSARLEVTEEAEHFRVEMWLPRTDAGSELLGSTEEHESD